MAFQTSLSGLAAAQSELAVTGNNIANTGTKGFKKSRAEFVDVYQASIYGSSSNAIGGGVRLADTAQQFSQGNIEFTDNPLDLAINGDGLFRLLDGGSETFSRAGLFKVDKNGLLVNSGGQQLTGYQATDTGEITGQLGTMRIDTSNISPLATGTSGSPGGVMVNLNLNSNEGQPTGTFDRNSPNTYNNSTSLTVYDSLGNPVLTSMYYVKTATANEWNVHTYLDYTDTDGNTTAIEMPPRGLGAGTPATLSFDSDGKLNSVAPASGTTNYIDYQPIVLSGVTGAVDIEFQIEYGESTQYGSDFSVNSLTQDGYATGRIAGVNVDESGVLFARYTNGESRALGQVALAKFANMQGLQPIGDSLWAETFDSGQPLVGAPGSASLGLVQSGSLESANVDLTSELVRMIVAQRNFQANAKMITTEDQISQTVINIR